MDTKYRGGTTKNTKYTKKKEGGREYEPRMDTNGHEWNHEIQEWNHENYEKHEKDRNP